MKWSTLMKLLIIICFTALIGACSSPNFVGDAPPVPVTSRTPEHFELPARFAFARVVYGTTQTAGAEEAALWTDLADRSKALGSFAPLIGGVPLQVYGKYANLIETARAQRFNYLILVKMNPSTGSADIVLYDVGSGGVMVTMQAISPDGGQRGFWGGRIRKPARLERATLKIAKAAVPAVEEVLRGVAKRQR
jgi:hypothetical protein